VEVGEGEGTGEPTLHALQECGECMDEGGIDASGMHQLTVLRISRGRATVQVQNGAEPNRANGVAREGASWAGNASARGWQGIRSPCPPGEGQTPLTGVRLGMR
jgi:hypothetical protein